MSCSSPGEVKSQKYAELTDHRVFEYEFPKVWKGIEITFQDFRVDSKEKNDEGTEGKLETDWIYAQSRDKYQEYKVNGLPRKKYLQTRLRYQLKAKQVLGGTQVQVKTEEEVERLKPDGSSAGFSKAPQVDSSRPNEILERINQNILASPP